jgi:hypothetical protein
VDRKLEHRRPIGKEFASKAIVATQPRLHDAEHPHIAIDMTEVEASTTPN